MVIIKYRVAQKSCYRKKIEYFPYAQTYWADFFIGDRDEFKVFLLDTVLNYDL
jgi:hypothetical protein